MPVTGPSRTLGPSRLTAMIRELIEKFGRMALKWSVGLCPRHRLVFSRFPCKYQTQGQFWTRLWFETRDTFRIRFAGGFGCAPHKGRVKVQRFLDLSELFACLGHLCKLEPCGCFPNRGPKLATLLFRFQPRNALEYWFQKP